MKTFQQVLALSCFVLLITVPAGCAGGPQSASFGEHIDDSVISTKVKTALLRDPDVSGFDINVSTFKGRVQLNGLVDNADQMVKAGELARNVSGVISVENNLAVK